MAATSLHHREMSFLRMLCLNPPFIIDLRMDPVIVCIFAKDSS
jgi:hypothetical protein